MRKMRLLALLSLLTVALLPGQGAQAQSANINPSIRVVSPANGATVSGERLVLAVAWNNFAFDAPGTNLDLRPGRGAYRVYVDGQLAAQDFGTATSLPSDLLPQIGAGQHTIDVKLVNVDGSPIASAQNTQIKVRLANAMSYAAKSGSPAIRIVEGPTSDGRGHFFIRTEITGYKLDGTRVNNKPESGIGHYHVYLDNEKLANVGVSEVSSIPSDIYPTILTPGDHEIYVILETHQHVPIPGGTSQRVKFTVRAQDIPAAPPASMTLGGSYFDQTKKAVRGSFLAYWQQSGGLTRFGYPISDELRQASPTDGKTYTMQYFERAIFEYHPEAGQQVLLSQLGSFRYNEKYKAGAPAQQANTSNPRQFTETSKTLGGRFRSYWEQNGGLASFGYPISNELQEKSELDGKSYLVQYFERAVFEYHPENAAPNDVLLTQLGTYRQQIKSSGQAVMQGMQH